MAEFSYKLKSRCATFARSCGNAAVQIKLFRVNTACVQHVDFFADGGGGGGGGPKSGERLF